MAVVDFARIAAGLQARPAVADEASVRYHSLFAEMLGLEGRAEVTS
jgi:hypothetical protein